MSSGNFFAMDSRNSGDGIHPYLSPRSPMKKGLAESMESKHTSNLMMSRSASICLRECALVGSHPHLGHIHSAVNFHRNQTAVIRNSGKQLKIIVLCSITRENDAMLSCSLTVRPKKCVPLDHRHAETQRRCVLRILRDILITVRFWAKARFDSRTANTVRKNLIFFIGCL